MNVQKLKEKAWAWGISSAFIFGFITHLFGLVNILHNCDDIAQQPAGYGTGITSGRFVLSVVGDIVSYLGGNYNLPVVNGILFVLLIAASAGLLIATLDIKSKRFSAVIGMLLAAFPAATGTLLFRYTSVYYGVGVLLAVAAAWTAKNIKFAGGGILLSATCTALSLGIYQAYVPITISILLLVLIQQALTERSDCKRLLLDGTKYCVCLILGLMLYFILLRLTLALYNEELSDYNGIGQMGKLAIKDIPGLVYRATYNFLFLPLRDYCGLASSKLLKIAYLTVYCLSVGITGYLLLFRIKKLSVSLLVIAFGILFPVAVNFIVVMCPNGWIYTLMLYSFAIVPCLPIALCESAATEKKGRGQRILSGFVGGLVAVMAFCYGYEANVNYTAMYYTNRQMENYLSSLVTQIRMTEGFSTEKEWAFIGDIEDPLMNCYWKYEMTIGGTEITELLLNRYSRNNWIQNYYGYLPTMVVDEKLEQLESMSVVQDMPCWPNEGSIRVIEDTVVVKFQDMGED